MTQAFNLAQFANKVNTSGQVDASTALTNAVPVANGGTGSITLAANNVLLGNGTSAVQAVAPGTAGNVLTSNGTTWASSASPVAPVDVQTFNAGGTWTKPTANQTMAQIQVWGGGGGGGTSTGGGYGAGGGGGGYNTVTIPISYLASSLTVVIGAGGAATIAGGTSSVPLATSWNGRSSITAYGGAGGSSTQLPGYGGSILSAGTTTAAGSPITDWTGGTGGEPYGAASSSVLYGGGGGGASAPGLTAGAVSVYGGAGGAGGATGSPGVAPGGAGGAATFPGTPGAGAAGRVVITCW